MPRRPREKSETGIYHVMVRGISRQDIFHDEDDFRRYLEILRKTSLESAVSILGYCLMSNHVHLLLRDGCDDISVFVKRVGISYAYWFNCKYERAGHVFQDRFQSECVEDEAYLLAVIRYIHQNPVKASILTRPEEYRWSSCALYYGADRNLTTFPSTSLILGILHNDIEKAIAALRQFTAVDNDDRCMDCGESNWISESEAFSITEKIMNGNPVTACQHMDQEARQHALCRLRNEGLSLRQICRITGLPLHVVRKAQRQRRRTGPTAHE